MKYSAYFAAATALALGSAACGSEPLFPPAGPDAAPDPSEYGPYPVGVRTIELVDRMRMTTGFTEPRKIVTEIWYPAVESSRGKSRAKYAPDDILPPSLLEGTDLSVLGVLDTYAVRDAEAREDDAPFPVVLFSHGNGGVRMQSTHLTVALASHGYVVASPDHEGNTLRDLLNAGEILPEDVLNSYADRPKDLQFILDWLERSREDDPVAAIADLSHVGTIGHSFGSVTALRTGGLDRRVDAVVAQAPAGYLLTWIDVGRPLAEIGIPVMLHVAGLDRTLEPEAHADRLWAEVAPPRYRADFPTGGHFTFSDLCMLDLGAIEKVDELGVGSVLEDGCGPENIAPEIAFPLIRLTAIGMFNAVLRLSPASLSYVASAGEALQVIADP
jgi:predicted dienelactone hydrolase